MLMSQAEVFWADRVKVNANHTLKVLAFFSHLWGFALVASLKIHLPSIHLPEIQELLPGMVLSGIAFVILIAGQVQTWLDLQMASLAVLRISERVQKLIWRGYVECDHIKAHARAIFDMVQLPKLPSLPIFAEICSWLHRFLHDVSVFEGRELNLQVTCSPVNYPTIALRFFNRMPRVNNLLC
jgi:hypothetical protein